MKLMIRRLGWRKKFFHVALVKENNDFKGYDVDKKIQVACLKEFASKDRYYRTSYFTVLQDVYVEPVSGLVFKSRGIFYPDALAIHTSVLEHFSMPFIFHCERLKRSSVYLEEAILLRHHYGEDNYFHFYFDVVTKLMEAMKNVKGTLPVCLIGEQQGSRPFFKEFMDLNPLGLTFFNQRQSAVRVKRLIVTKAVPYDQKNMDAVRRVFQTVDNQEEFKNWKRIFVVRASHDRRALQNRNKLSDELSRRGFVVLNPGDFSLSEQISIFKSAKIIVGEHGAGLVNILHSGESVSLLELFHPSHLSPCYCRISKQLGINYNSIIGSSLDDGYSVPVDEVISWFDRVREQTVEKQSR